MGLTAPLPTRGSGQPLGPTKDDNVGDPEVRYIFAAEWNEAARTLEEVCAEVGLGDGSTAGSLVSRMTSAERRLLIYEPAGVAGGNVYTTADSLLDRLETISQPVTVRLHDDITIDGPRNLNDVYFTGLIPPGDFGCTAILAADAEITTKYIEFNCRVTNNRTVNAPILGHANGALVIVRAPYASPSNMPLVAAGANVILIMENANGASGLNTPIPSPLMTIDTGCFGIVYLEGRSTIDTAALTGSGTSYTFVNGAAAFAPETMPGLGAYACVVGPNAAYVSYDDTTQTTVTLGQTFTQAAIDAVKTYLRQSKGRIVSGAAIEAAALGETLFVNTSGGPAEIQLPAANSAFRLVVKKTTTDTNTITLLRLAAESIEGTAGDLVLPNSGAAARGNWVIACDGTNFWLTTSS